MKTLAERVQLALSLANKSQTSLAKDCGVTQPTVAHWLSGRTKQLKADVAAKAAASLGVSVKWLTEGRGDMKPLPLAEGLELSEIGSRKIPLINYVQAGKWTGVGDYGGIDSFVLSDLDLSNDAFALIIRGRSMLPEFREGDRIIVDPEVVPIPGDYVVAQNGEDEATFKKYKEIGTDENGDKVIELVPLNPDFPTMRSDRDPIRIIGTMIEHRRYRR